MSPASAGSARQEAGADTPASRGRPRSAEAEEAILRAAIEILGDVGYASFSIEAVAARAGVGRPTVYRRWPSKLELVVEAVSRMAPPLKVTDSGDPLADLRSLVTALVADMTGSATGQAIMALASDPEAHAELTPRLSERLIQPRRAVTASLLQRAASNGQIDPGIDPGMLIDLMVGAATYRWMITGRPVSRQAAGQIIDTVLSLAAPQSQ